MIKRIKKLLSMISEDYLDLQEKIVRIGVLSYAYQKGMLSDKKIEILREFIREATDDVSSTISEWLGEHGLIDKAISIGGNYRDLEDCWEQIYSEIINSLPTELAGCVESDGSYYSQGLRKIARGLSDALGGSGYFGEDACDEDDLKTFIDANLESEITDEGTEDEHTYYYLDVNDNTVLNFLIELKKDQVEGDSYFVDLADDMIDTINEIKENIDTEDIGNLIVNFDKLKDLHHANGNLLHDYGDVDWNKVNLKIDDRIKSLDNLGEI